MSTAYLVALLLLFRIIVFILIAVKLLLVLFRTIIIILTDVLLLLATEIK